MSFEHLRHKPPRQLARPRELLIVCAPMRSNSNLSRIARERLRDEGYRLVGLEQTTDSHDMHRYQFQRKTALVIGNERTGLTPDLLKLLHDVVEIPVWGLPYSYNVATATTMALYEYCRQYPDG